LPERLAIDPRQGVHNIWEDPSGDAFATPGRPVGYGRLDRRIPYRPGDQFDGDRIIGFTTFDGSSHELVALFNAESRRSR
jgi:hypothetical protein